MSVSSYFKICVSMFISNFYFPITITFLKLILIKSPIASSDHISQETYELTPLACTREKAHLGAIRSRN